MSATSKLVKAWESKTNQRALKAGGGLTMALTLAACGGTDITQAQLDAEVAAAESAAAEAAAAAAAQAAAEAEAADAAAAQAAAEAAQAEAEAAQAAAEAAQAAAEAEAAALTTPVVASLTASNDVLTGNAGDDSFTGTTATDAAGDVIVDTSTTDNDTLTMTLTGDLPAITVTNVENVVLNSSALVGVDLDVANITNGTTTVNLTAVGNNGQATVDNLTASNALVAGTGVTTFIVDTAADGATVTAGAATTRMDVSSSAADEALTINAAAALVDVNNITGGGAVVADLTINFAADTDIALDAIGDSLVIAGGDGTISAASSVLNGETVTNGSTGTFAVDVDIDGAHDLSDVEAARFDVTYNATGGAVTFADTGVDLQINETFGLATTATGTAATEAANSITAVVSTSALTNFNFANYRTVNLSADEDTTITSLSVEATNNLVLSGAADITLATDVTALSVDGSAMTGALNATFDNAMATATGGAGADTLDFTSGTSTTVTATGNAGNDTITFLGVAGLATTVTVDGGAGNDNLSVDTTQTTITYDGGVGNDTLTLANGDYSAAAVSLTGVEILAVTTGGATTLDASTVSGQTLVLSGNAAAGDVTIAMDGATLDASNLVSDSTVGITNTAGAIAGVSLTVTGTAHNDVLTGDNVADAIVGGAGDDVISAGAGADEINAGAGADDISGEAGADTVTAGEGADEVVALDGDTISLAETTSAGDNVIMQVITAGSAAGTAAGTFSGFNVVTGFTSGTDDFVFDDGTTATYVGDTVAAGDEFISATNIYTSVSNTGVDNDLALADITDVDEVLGFINASAYTTSTATQNDIVAITFDDFTAMYVVTDAVAGGDIVAGEVTMLGTVDDILVAGDMIIT